METMTPQPAVRRRHRRPVPIGEHAVADLRFIRETMERAAGVTAFPGWGQVAIGVTALAAAPLAMRTVNPTAWLGVWLVESVLAMAIGAAAMAFKARNSGPLFANGAMRRFALAFALPLVAGAVLTARLHQLGAHDLLPGVWLLTYGVGITAGGAFSVAAVRAMGGAFMLAGSLALFAPAGHRDLWMAGGFGVLHIGFGLWIARRHGG
jgi:hypothetical protein